MTGRLLDPKVSGSKLRLICFIIVAGACFISVNYYRIHNFAHADHQQLQWKVMCTFMKCDLHSLHPHKDVPTLVRAPSGALVNVAEATANLTTRVCGSPAVDGYAHVKVECLDASPTVLWWRSYIASGGSYEDFVIHTEMHADYDGLAVFWGINNKKMTIEECGAHCKNHRPGLVDGPFKNFPCNAFAWCPDDVCFEPDAHKHTKGDCWLKFTEAPAAPEVNMRGQLPSSFLQRHPKSPAVVQWAAGVLLPPGVKLTNGTFGPRWNW